VTGLPEKYASARFEKSHVIPRAATAPPKVAARTTRIALFRVDGWKRASISRRLHQDLGSAMARM
jgi:hypothetical protein